MENLSPFYNSTITCFLCHNVIVKRDARSNEGAYDWEIIWLRKCSESLALLLDVEGFESTVFLTGLYCAQCTMLIREVDFTIRTVTSMQSRLSKLRTQIAKFLISAIDSCDIDEDILSKQEQVPLSPPMKIDHDLSQQYNDEALIDSSAEYIQKPGSPVPDLDQDFSSSEVNIQAAIPEETLQAKDNLVTLQNKIATRSSRRLKMRISYLEEETDEDGILERNYDSSYESTTERKSERGDSDLITSDVKECQLSNKRPKIVNSREIGQARSKKTCKNQELLWEPTITPSLTVSPQAPISIPRKAKVPKMIESAFVTKMKSRFWKIPDEEYDSLLRSFVQSLSEGTNSNPLDAESESLFVHLLRSEIEDYHQNARTYVCTHAGCLGRFTSVHKLQIHATNYHGQHFYPPPFQCFECDLRFYADKALNAHIHRVHENDPYAYDCDGENCGRKFKKASSLINHIKKCHKNVIIPYMGGLSTSYAYRDKVAMATRKIKRSKTPKSNYCTVDGCYYRAATQELITLHHRQVHDKLSHPFPCKICGKDFRTMKHYRSHPCTKKRDDHQCEHCEKTFGVLNKLKRHIRNSHKEVLQFKCSLCQRCYNQAEDARRHEKLHTSVTGFNCVLGACAEYFENLEDLRIHVAGVVHDVTQKTCVCEHCGYVSKGTRASQLMTMHIRTHTGDSPFKCRFCDKRFKTNPGRRSHEEINHADLVEKRIYSCKECEATFTVAQYLFKHNAWHKYGSNACRPVVKKRY